MEALREAEPHTTPFPYLVATCVLRQPALALVSEAFPRIAQPGVFPLSALTFGENFARLIAEIRGRELESILEKKFAVTLSDKPLMITVRGQAQKRDGQIHADSTDKFLTCLLYVNTTGWQPEGGRLRLLRGPNSLDDMIAEVPPAGGNFVAFRRTDHSWHGHQPYEGQRRIVMFNWLVNKTAYLKNLGRHKISAAVKHLAHAS